jgi:tRNA (mo5U34)-methyltransferase
MTQTQKAWSEEAIRRRLEVADIEWWHEIDLGHGVHTPGRGGDTGRRLDRLHLPADLGGRTVLDIGAADGAFSFACERRGAERVVAVNEDRRAGLFLAVEMLGSSVEPLVADLMELEPEDIGGPFDVVIFSGVLYHLPDPIGGLRQVHRLTAPGGLVVLETDTRLNYLEQPAAEFVEHPPEAINYDRNWWRPNRAAVIEMCVQVGFEDVQIVHEPARDHPWLRRLAGAPVLWRLTAGDSRLSAHLRKGVGAGG